MDFLEKVGDKAKEVAEIARLRSQIASCEEAIKKNYMEIGRLYCEQNTGEDGIFAKQCQTVANAQKGIRELEKKIQEIKGIR